MKQELLDLYTQFARVSSTSGNEGEVRLLITTCLDSLNITHTTDTFGNVTASIPGKGKPLLINAHMDRVKPGLGHIPIMRGDLIYSDGLTNSGSDDTLGIISILTILKALHTSSTHRPIHAIFTIEEEIGGKHGAKVVLLETLKTDEGIVIDNAFNEAGTIVAKGSNLVWAITHIHGKSVHSGKSLDNAINALSVLLRANIRTGSYNNDETRVNIGSVTTLPGLGNAIPGEVTVLTELRSFLSQKDLHGFIDTLFANLYSEAKAIGATIDMQLDTHCESYTVDMNEPLVHTYKDILIKKGSILTALPTFVGSDCNSFRARGIKTFVISTGARNEHTSEEFFDINGITTLTQDIIDMLTA